MSVSIIWELDLNNITYLYQSIPPLPAFLTYAPVSSICLNSGLLPNTPLNPARLIPLFSLQLFSSSTIRAAFYTLRSAFAASFSAYVSSSQIWGVDLKSQEKALYHINSLNPFYLSIIMSLINSSLGFLYTLRLPLTLFN
jgi:hypothetical protein